MKDAYYFQHDANARNDPKIQAMMQEYGAAGYGWYWMVVESLREARGYRLEMEEYIWLSFGRQFGCSSDEAKQFIEDCCQKFRLFVQDNGHFYAQSLIERMVKLDLIREKRRDAGRKSHGWTEI